MFYYYLCLKNSKIIVQIIRNLTLKVKRLSFTLQCVGTVVCLLERTIIDLKKQTNVKR